MEKQRCVLSLRRWGWSLQSYEGDVQAFQRARNGSQLPLASGRGASFLPKALCKSQSHIRRLGYHLDRLMAALPLFPLLSPSCIFQNSSCMFQKAFLSPRPTETLFLDLFACPYLDCSTEGDSLVLCSQHLARCSPWKYLETSNSQSKASENLYLIGYA